MDLFHYQHGELFAEGVPVHLIAEQVSTPTYVYSASTLAEHFRRLQHAFAPLAHPAPLICFSVKSCSNLAVLAHLAALGAGMDVVSGGELERARRAAVPMDRVVFAGVGKSADEIRAALHLGVACFNIESTQEADLIDREARAAGRAARAAVRLNPGVKAGGHAYISTGTTENKFGVPPDEAVALIRRFHRAAPASDAPASAAHGLSIVGLHVHIGSSITDPAPFQQAAVRALAVLDAAAAQCPGWKPEVLNLGGGFGADYRTGQSPPASVFAEALIPLLRPRVAQGLRIILEPGRTIAAGAGILLTRVRYVKRQGDKAFIIADAGMHTLIRPSLYDAFHFIWPARVPPHHVPPRREDAPDLPGLHPADVVGPICESGDFLARARLLPPVEPGDLLAVFTAGAYGMSMASRYNSQPLPAEVLVEGDAWRVIRRRETLQDLVREEV